jgi:hypothetical protein
MTCPECGRYADPDPSTGYDADDLCLECAERVDALPSDPSDTLEESIERLTETVDRHVARMDHIRKVLGDFYLAPISASSLQPVLALAEQLNPTLVHRRLVALRIEEEVLRFAPSADDDIITPDSSPF